MGVVRVLRRRLQRLRENASAQGTLLILPALGWTVVFLVLPLLLILVLSLAWRGQYGPVDWGANPREFFAQLSLESYLRLVDPLYISGSHRPARRELPRCCGPPSGWRH